MKIELLVTGKTVSPWVKEGIGQYLSRLVHYTDFSLTEIPDVRNAGKLKQEQVKVLEGELILKRLTQPDCLVLLDDKGKLTDSERFASFLQGQMNQGLRKLVFVVGGAWGFSEEVYERARHRISLSPMTFNHELVRVIFLEQLYRAFTILKGEPYHHR